ncbi:MAG: pantoate--beta-alanine ligase [Geobacter sp.]|nr:pantoate--beta-alanine ligase [Geobacter sp.]
MQIIESPEQMQQFALAARQRGERIALVPTMGYLHEGHASLMREGRRRADLLVVSIFVNPTQFGVGEDFEKYPRDMARDSALAAAAGVDVIFAPTAAAMYPHGYQTYVDAGPLTEPLCGASRPGHFRGVTTVVCKLFNIVQPDVALFGRKDYQQLAVIRQMAIDLNMPVEIAGMPIVREPDGLAMSSRNVYLSPAERGRALALKRALDAARTAFAAGERSVNALENLLKGVLSQEDGVEIDYAEIRDGMTLERSDFAVSGSLAAIAVRVGKTRLIDNCLLGAD